MEKTNTKRIILVIGPPGAGKGTQCELVANRLGFDHISTGDMIREAIKNNTELGKLAEPFETKGSLVPDVIINDIVIDYLAKAKKGILLDGFPRTLSQGLALHSNKDISIERLLIIQCPENVCLGRISKRNDPYRLEKDRDEDYNKGRIKFYNDNFKDIFELFRGKVQIVNGNDETEKITENILKLVDEDPSKGDMPLDLLKPEIVIKKITNQLCVVCMTNVADYLIVPCGHQCGCQMCLNTIKSAENKCPICRNRITDLIKVFKSGLANEDEEIEIEIEKEMKKLNVKGAKKATVDKDKLKEVKPIDIKANYDDKKLEGEIQIKAALSQGITSKTAEKVNVGISIEVPDIKCRVPVDVCCVIDVSGSMSDDAKFQDPEDETKTKTDGMSILDLVKHSVKTVIHTLTEEDRLSLVSFHTNAKIEFKLHSMNETNREAAIRALEALTPLDSTNIWEGLRVGLDSLILSEDADKPARRKFVFLLTDGQPNMSPQEGEASSLKNYLNMHPRQYFQIHTFGFGYRLDSKLLTQISTTGGGAFGFIPDAKIVGTNFVNCIANAVTTLSLNSKVHLIPLGGSTFAGDVGGCVPFDKTESEYVVSLGNLQFGQVRNISVPMNINNEENYLAVILEYEGYVDDKTHKVNYIANSRSKTRDAVAAYARSYLVSETIDIISSFASGKAVKAQKAIESLSKDISVLDNEYENDDERLNGLVCDLIGFGGNGGRMTKAISTNERFGRWGAHYLRSICRAHQLQLRTNFMDTGLQVYGGETFNNLQDIGGKIFIDLPIVKSKNNYNEYSNNSNNNNYSSNTNYVAPVVDNTAYYGGSGGGCFDESCTTEILDNKEVIKIQLKNVKKGDYIKVYINDIEEFAKVICVVRITLDSNENLIVFPKTGLKITKRHPVYHNQQWMYPIDIAKTDSSIARINEDDRNAKVVYNFVLEKGHIIKVNDIPCVTFGHNVKEVYHRFYGTNEVIDVLRKSKDFESGFIKVSQNVRNLLNN